MPSFIERVKSSYQILSGITPFSIPNEKLVSSYMPVATGYYRSTYDTSASVLAPIQNRIGIDVASVPLKHVIVDEDGMFLDYKKSELNDRLCYQANIDQTGTAFIQDATMTMLANGACVIVPVETSAHPSTNDYEILSMRVGFVTEWMNYSVRVDVWSDLEGRRVEIILPKNFVAICYNPFYAIMNEPNSTVRRLIDKLALLDVADSRLYSAQLDLIIQLSYSAKSERRQREAERRLQDLETQLYDSKYGIAYVDANERVTQLNRPVTNTLVESVNGLTESLHSQLGLTPAVFNGTAGQEEMRAYENKTVYPILKALSEGMTTAFFSRTAIRQGNAIRPIPNLFKMAPLGEIAEAADKLTRNEIMTTNEIRANIGMKASDDPNADELRNKNLNRADQVVPGETSKPVDEEKE